MWTRFAAKRELRGRHFAANGTPLGDADGTLIVPDAKATDLSWDGSRFFLTWNSTIAATAHGAWLESAEGALMYETRWREIDGDVMHVALGPGRVATVYSRFDRADDYGAVARAFSNIIPFPQLRKRAVR